MKSNKLKLLLVCLILILSVGMVSATESVSADTDVHDGNEYLNTVNEVDIISEGTGTFTDLNELIEEAKLNEQTTINLTRDYKFGPTDNAYINGIQIDGVTINGNGHTIDGNLQARIFTQFSGHVVLNNITFINGYAQGKSNGGAYLLQSGSGNLTVNNCVFENNFAGQHGGAIGVSLNDHDNPIEIYDSTFIGNSARFNGGAVYASKLEVDNSYFEENKILARSSTEYTHIEQKGLGGAICSVDSKIRNSLFKKNDVENSGYWQIEEGGGAITSLKTMSVDNCTFDSNNALKGGAIFGIAGFESYLNPSNYINVTNSKFINNVAQSGGAICSNFNTTVDNSLFNNNTASGYGGGAINTGYKSNSNNFTNCNFTNNEAYNYGGAISSSHSRVENCLFENNTANHGGAIFSLSFSVDNSTFKDNVGTLGNETIVVVDGIDKDALTDISDDEIKVFDQTKINNYNQEVLNGQTGNSKYIESGTYAGYEVYCIEQHLFYPDDTEGVMVTDLTYITNSVNRQLVGEYIRILFALRELYPARYASYSLADIQSIIWIFTDGDYTQHLDDQLIRDILDEYNNPTIEFNDTTFMLIGDEDSLRVYDMQIFLTPTDRQNMVLFEAHPFVPIFNETVKKDTLNETVLVGEDVEFRITVTNNGNQPLEDVFISDIQYSNGLVYKTWRNDKGSWTYKGNGKWVLNYVLETYDNASLIVVFKTRSLGNLTNTVTSGYQNYTLSNATNVTKTTANPVLSVVKISNNPTSKTGDEIHFTIIVKNIGEYDCTGVYIEDKDYSDGLVYDYYVDPTNSWKYQGNNRWNYNGVLKAGQESKIILYFFVKSKIEGELYNTVTVGNNMTNKTVNSTNTTIVVKPKKNITEENKTKNETNKTVSKPHKYKQDRYATGNPLYALTLVLICLGVILPRRRK